MNQRKVLSWHSTWMNLAHEIAKRSKDPSTQCGAVVVKGKKELGIGYNGPPEDIDDNSFDWNDRSVKYPLVFHAESNALWHAANAHGVKELERSILYVTSEPCYRCVLECVRAKLNYIVYDDTDNAKTAVMCDDSNWKLVELIINKSQTCIRLYSVLLEMENKNVERKEQTTPTGDNPSSYNTRWEYGC